MKIAVVGGESIRRQFPKRDLVREFRGKREGTHSFAEVFLEKLHESHPDESLRTTTKPP